MPPLVSSPDGHWLALLEIPARADLPAWSKASGRETAARLTLWQLNSSEEPLELPLVGVLPGSGLALSPDNRLFVVSKKRGATQVWDLVERAALFR